MWCTNGRDKTITLFFNVISLYINTLLTFFKKFFYSSQIEFLGHIVEIRLHGLLQLIIIEKPRSVKGLLQKSKLVEVAGCQVGWVRWVRQLLKPDVLHYGLCNSRRVLDHYRAATADLGSEFPFASPSLPDADLWALHLSMVQSLLSSVVGNPPVAHLCNSRKLWPQLSSRRWVLNFLGGRELTCFHCIDSCLVSGSQWWIHVSSPVIMRDNTLSGVAL